MNINWTRGAFRTWVIVSTIWFLLVSAQMLSSMNVNWAGRTLPPIQVQFSDSDILSFPSDWEENRIRDGLQRHADQLTQREKQWAASLPASVVSDCGKTSPTVPLRSMSDDCLRLLISQDQFGVPLGWENKLHSFPKPRFRAAMEVLPIAVGPPLVVLILGFAVAWILRGFSASSLEALPDPGGKTETADRDARRD